MSAAWLYAQFVTSKTVSLRKSIVGLTFIRESDIKHDYFTRNAARYGGLVEFYRSPARVALTPTGTNVPDYPRMARLWWTNVATAVKGEKTPQVAMDSLARAMDDVLADLQGSGMRCTPDSIRRIRPRFVSKGAPGKTETKNRAEKPSPMSSYSRPGRRAACNDPNRRPARRHHRHPVAHTAGPAVICRGHHLCHFRADLVGD
jgi:glycerol transport system substrate-binding protein